MIYLQSKSDFCYLACTRLSANNTIFVMNCVLYTKAFSISEKVDTVTVEP